MCPQFVSRFSSSPHIIELLVTMTISIDVLNQLELADFIEAIGWVFEDSPWVAERAWKKKPFSDLSHLHRSMVNELSLASEEELLALLRAHPDLGTRARMTDASTAEQAGAGLDRLNSEEFEKLQHLNSTYREKMGFPFLFAVKGSTKYDILAALERRVGETRESEFKEALRQVHQIALFRLQETIV